MKSKQLPTNKSDLLKKLSDNYPNFYKKDLSKLLDIFIFEIKNSLKRKERVEIRDVFSLEPKLHKAKYARNQKTNEKIFAPNCMPDTCLTSYVLTNKTLVTRGQI